MLLKERQMLCGGRLGTIFDPCAGEPINISASRGVQKQEGVEEEEEEQRGGQSKGKPVHSFTHYKIFIC